MTRSLILAAGRGSRLGALTDERPKCLVPFHGRPLLERQIEALTAGGASPVAMVTGYRAEMLVHRASWTFLNPDWASTGVVGSLSTAGAWLEAEDTVVSYGDIFYSADTVKRLSAVQAPIAVAFDPDWLLGWSARFEDPRVDAETFRMEGSRIVEIGGRIGDLDTVEGQFTGLLKITVAGWSELASITREMGLERARSIDMTTLLSIAIARGTEVTAVPVTGPWGEIDSPSDLDAYERLFPEI